MNEMNKAQKTLEGVPVSGIHNAYQASLYLNVKLAALYRLIRDGKITYFKTGHLYFFTISDLESYIFRSRKNEVA